VAASGFSQRAPSWLTWAYYTVVVEVATRTRVSPCSAGRWTASGRIVAHTEVTFRAARSDCHESDNVRVRRNPWHAPEAFYSADEFEVSPTCSQVGKAGSAALQTSHNGTTIGPVTTNELAADCFRFNPRFPG
jgi:hypothetical protein